MLTDLTLHMMIPTYHMAKSSGCVSNELVWIVALASSSTIRNKSLFYQKNELTLTLTLTLKVFSTNGRRVQRATVYVVGLGYYKLYLDGGKVAHHKLTSTLTLNISP